MGHICKLGNTQNGAVGAVEVLWAAMVGILGFSLSGPAWYLTQRSWKFDQDHGAKGEKGPCNGPPWLAIQKDVALQTLLAHVQLGRLRTIWGPCHLSSQLFSYFAFLCSLPTSAPLLSTPASTFWYLFLLCTLVERLLLKCVPGRRMIDWIEAWRWALWLRREYFMCLHLRRAQHVAMHEEGEATRLHQIRKVHCKTQRWQPWQKQCAWPQLRSNLIYCRPSLDVTAGPGMPYAVTTNVPSLEFTLVGRPLF